MISLDGDSIIKVLYRPNASKISIETVTRELDQLVDAAPDHWFLIGDINSVNCRP